MALWEAARCGSKGSGQAPCYLLCVLIRLKLAGGCAAESCCRKLPGSWEREVQQEVGLEPDDSQTWPGCVPRLFHAIHQEAVSQALADVAEGRQTLPGLLAGTYMTLCCWIMLQALLHLRFQCERAGGHAFASCLA